MAECLKFLAKANKRVILNTAMEKHLPLCTRIVQIYFFDYTLLKSAE